MGVAEKQGVGAALLRGAFRGAQVGGVGHGLGAASCGDDTLGDLVELTVHVGLGGRAPRCVMLGRRARHRSGGENVHVR
jgi:hypothetical protein